MTTLKEAAFPQRLEQAEQAIRDTAVLMQELSLRLAALEAQSPGMALAELADYVCHISWRCEHQDRWPWGEGEKRNCRCGLVFLLRKLGFEDHVAENAPIGR